VIVLLVTACSGTSSPKPTATPTTTANTPNAGHVRATVMLVGDSNIAVALSSIAFELTGRDEAYQLVDVARAGAAIRTDDCPALTPNCATHDFWEHRLAEALQRVSPDGFIVNLGINDTDAPGTPDTQGYTGYDAKIDWLMHLLPAAKPVLWSNLPCDIEPKTRAVGCAAVNAAIKAAPRRWPYLIVLDWASVATGHPNYVLPARGEVHLSVQGGLAWADLIAKTLDARFPARTH
jgi:hypothetical protein